MFKFNEKFAWSVKREASIKKREAGNWTTSKVLTTESRKERTGWVIK